MKHAILLLAISASTLLTPTLNAKAQSIDKLVDSLFVVASSGELKYRDQVEPAKAQLAELGAKAVSRLISKLTTPDARERLTVIRILKTIGQPAAPLLSSALQTLQTPIQLKRICWALGDIGPEALEATDELIKACEHDNWQVREYALRALGKILGNTPTDAAFNIVSQRMSDSVGQTRKSAVWAAGQFQDLALTNNLLIALNDSYYGARLNAVSALVKIATDSATIAGNTEQVIDELGKYTKTDHTAAGDLACRALGMIGAKLANLPESERDNLTAQIVSALEKQFRSQRKLRRGAAVRALGEFTPGDEWGILVNLRLTESSIYVIQSIDSAIARFDDTEKTPE